MDLITVSRKAGFEFGIQVRGHEVGSDLSEKDGGGDAGPSPAELLAGSLGACIAMAQSKGYVETILGRRRKIPQILARNPQQRALGERMAINTVVQGSAADLIKVAMIDLYDQLPRVFPEHAPKLLLQIHDELVLEARDDVAEAAQSFVVERMEHAMELAVPLDVDAARSTVWIDAK